MVGHLTSVTIACIFAVLLNLKLKLQPQNVSYLKMKLKENNGCIFYCYAFSYHLKIRLFLWFHVEILFAVNVRIKLNVVHYVALWCDQKHVILCCNRLLNSTIETIRFHRSTTLSIVQNNKVSLNLSLLNCPLN